MRHWRRFPFVSLALAVLCWSTVAAVSCTHDQVWVASGESIAALGTTYDQTGAMMEKALDAKVIDEATFRRWAAFCHYYRPIYDTARERWLHADDSGSAHAAAVLSALAAELTQWGLVAAGGKP